MVPTHLTCNGAHPLHIKWHLSACRYNDVYSIHNLTHSIRNFTQATSTVIYTKHSNAIHSKHNDTTQLTNDLFLPSSLNFCVGVCISFTTVSFFNSHFAYSVPQIVFLFKVSRHTWQEIVAAMSCGSEAELQNNFFRL
jgi:hypothetical protein